MGVLEIFDRCPRDIKWVSWRYLMGVLEMFDGCPGDIYVCPGYIGAVSWR